MDWKSELDGACRMMNPVPLDAGLAGVHPLNCSGHCCCHWYTYRWPRYLCRPGTAKHTRSLTSCDDSCPQLADVEDRRRDGEYSNTSTPTHCCCHWNILVWKQQWEFRFWQ